MDPLKDKEINKLAIRHEVNSSHFTSILSALEIQPLFDKYERANRGYNMKSIIDYANQLLENIPGWNQLRLKCAGRLRKEKRYDEAIAFLEAGLIYKADINELKSELFSLLLIVDTLKASMFLRQHGLKYLRNDLGLRKLKDFMIELNDYSFLNGYLGLIRFLDAKKREISIENYLFMIQCSENYDALPISEDNKVFLQDIKHSLKLIYGIDDDTYQPLAIYSSLAEIPINHSILGLLSKCFLIDSELASFDFKTKLKPESDKIYRHYLSLRQATARFKPNEKKKIALCISGQARDMVRSSSSIKRLIDAIDCEVDFYFTIWEKNGVRFPEGTNLDHLSRIIPAEVVDVFNRNIVSGKQILTLYPSISAWIESFEVITKEHIKNIYPKAKSIEICKDPYVGDSYVMSNYGSKWLASKFRNQLRMYDLVNRVINTALKNSTYSHIIRIRPDAIVSLREEEISKLLSAASMNPDCVFVDRLSKKNTPSDSFAIGVPQAMAWYASLIKMAPSYNEDSFYNAMPTAHVILHDHLKTAGFVLNNTNAISIKSFASPELGVSDLIRIINHDSSLRASDPLDTELLCVLKNLM